MKGIAPALKQGEYPARAACVILNFDAMHPDLVPTLSISYATPSNRFRTPSRPVKFKATSACARTTGLAR